KYENFHQVTYSNETIRACVELSNRYIQDRYLPDKAIDLMDEAGSKLNLTIKTPTKEEAQQRLSEIEKEKQSALAEENYELAAELCDETLQLQIELSADTTDKIIALTTDHIPYIIESKTGIPVGTLHSQEQQKMKNLDENLANKVIGQEE